MKRDRYVARTAGTAEGRLRTEVRPLAASKLSVNAEMYGSLTARVVDRFGAPYPGFDRTDCAPVSGDSLDRPLEWSSPLSSLIGKEVAFEFSFSDGSLYAFNLED
jgi:hypothetical protein